MKQANSIIGLLLLCCCITMSNAQQDVCRSLATEKISGEQRSVPLQLVANIIKKKRYKADKELDGLKMEMSLTFTNVSQKPLILYKGSNLVTQIMVSRSIKDALLQHYEVNSTVTHITHQLYEGNNKTSFNELFVILLPNSSYTTRTTIGLFLARAKNTRVSGAIDFGEHVLQIRVLTWIGSEDLAKKLQESWKEKGLLFYDPVVSNKIRFKI